VDVDVDEDGMRLCGFGEVLCMRLNELKDKVRRFWGHRPFLSTTLVLALLGYRGFRGVWFI
jgi:hypothetical protein